MCCVHVICVPGSRSTYILYTLHTVISPKSQFPFHMSLKPKFGFYLIASIHTDIGEMFYILLFIHNTNAYSMLLNGVDICLCQKALWKIIISIYVLLLLI